MLPRFAKGKFQPKNSEKYIGLKTPTYRSSWEQTFMRLCDEHPNVAKWASESIKIPYRHPFTGKKKQAVINMAKWEAANAYAKQNKIRFRVLSEEQLFHNGTRK